MNDLILNGTRRYVTLSGDHDEDYFLTSEDMSQGHWQLLMGCHHTGQCDDDTEEAALYFEIKDYKAALNYLVSTGIEKEQFLDDDEEQDDHEILKYYLWMIAGDIQERTTEEENDESHNDIPNYNEPE